MNEPTARDSHACTRWLHSLWIPASLVAFSLYVRILTLPYPHLGGDAMLLWFRSRQLVEGLSANAWPWTHHATRVGILGVSTLVQGAFGPHALNYYLPALIMSSIQVVFLWKLGVLLRARGAAVFAIAGLVMSEPMVRVGADLNPAVFSGAYGLICLYLLLKYLERGQRHVPTLIGAALAFFAAYLSKVTNLFFLPGMLAAVLIVYRRPRDAALLLVMIAGLIGLETLLYAIFTDFTGGRMQVIASSHLTSHKLVVHSFWDLWTRFDRSHMSLLLRALLLVTVLATLALAVIRERVPRSTWTLVWATASFVLATTLAIKSLDPLVPAQRMLERYMFPVLPLLWLLLGLAASHLLPLGWRDAPARLRPRKLAVALFALLALWGWLDLGPSRWQDHTIARILRQREKVDRAFATGVPIVAFETMPHTMRLIRTIILSRYSDFGYQSVAPRIRRSPGMGERSYFVLLHDRYLSEGASAASLERSAQQWRSEQRPVLRVDRSAEGHITLRLGPMI